MKDNTKRDNKEEKQTLRKIKNQQFKDFLTANAQCSAQTSNNRFNAS